MHGEIARLQLFQMWYDFPSNIPFLAENFDDFCNPLHEKNDFSEKKRILTFLHKK
jgi:hypothetical protein